VPHEHVGEEGAVGCNSVSAEKILAEVEFPQSGGLSRAREDLSASDAGMDVPPRVEGIQHA
jgi:hypothetical protein